MQDISQKEKDIITRILNGESSLFERIVESYSTMIFRVAMGYLHSKEDAEDITQEVFIKAYRSLSTFNMEAQLSTWLYRITVNSCLNHIERKQKKSIFSRLEDSTWLLGSRKSADKNPEEQSIAKEKAEAIRVAIDSLPEKQRSAFILQKYNELSQKEISVIMEITEGAVEQLLMRAKNNLKSKLKNII